MISLRDYIIENLEYHIFEESDPFNIFCDDKESDIEEFSKRINPQNDNKVNKVIKELFELVYSYISKSKLYEIPFRYSKNRVKLNRPYQNTNEFINQLRKIEGISVSKNNFEINNHKILYGRGSINGGNKGNNFELYFDENFNIYIDKLKKVLNISDLDVIKKEVVGRQNNPRGNDFFGKPENIGAIIADIKLTSSSDEEIYLSLKYKTQLVLANYSISTILSKDYLQGETESSKGDELLEKLGINKEMFNRVFDSYNPNDHKNKKRAKYKDYIKIHDEKILQNVKALLLRALGYGYVCIWAPTSNYNEVQMHNITKENYEQMVGNINNIEIKYPEDNEAKRVEILIDNDGTAFFKLVFRSKDGSSVYPKFLTVEYKPIKK